MLNWQRTVISQYSNSATLNALLESMNDCIDPCANLQAFYDAVWNVNTAYGFGLDIWGRIVGISRLLNIPNDGDYLGFSNTSVPQDWQPFNHGTFYSGDGATQTYELDDDTYRLLILTKALANITATTARGMNALLQMLFPGRGRALVLDNGSMSMSFLFNFQLTTAEYAILSGSGVLPHPAGVQYNVIMIPTRRFGFKQQSEAQTFNNGVFYVH